MPRMEHPAACAGMPFAEKGSRERKEEMERNAASYSSSAAWVAPVGFSGDSLPLNRYMMGLLFVEFGSDL